VIAAAAVASVLALVNWGGLLWRYLQPSAFNGRVVLGPPKSAQFALFVAGAAVHFIVLAGVAIVPLSRRVARAALLTGAAGVVAMALYQFGSSTVRTPFRGPDRLIVAASAGSWFGTQAIPHLLLIYCLARRPRFDRRAADAAEAFASESGTPSTELRYFPGAKEGLGSERAAIVLAAAVASVAAMLGDVAIAWIMLAPQSFRTVFSSPGGYEKAMLAIGGTLDLVFVCGAAALLLRRRRVGRRLLLAGAFALILLHLIGQTRFLISPPRNYPRYAGAERLLDVVGAVARFGAAVIVYALAVAAVGRRWPQAGTRSGN